MDMANKKEADELYVLLKKNYRISRNIRLIWFFDNILKDVHKLPHVSCKNDQVDDSTGHEIQVLSVIPKHRSVLRGKDIQPIAEDVPDEEDSASDETTECLMQPSTKVYFLSRAYRLVFALDLSPSIFRIDAPSCRTVVEGVLSSLADCLCSLMQPFQVPGSDITLQPNIYVTIFAQSRPAHKSRERYLQEVIVQGCLLTPKSVIGILKTVECKIYHGMKQWTETGLKDTPNPVRHDHGLVSMLRTGLLALQLLPANTSAGIIVITDGMVGVPDMAVLETLLNQLRSTTTSCSFLHIPSSQAVNCDFAYCANTELLQFIAAATYGTWFESCSDDNYKTKGMNLYQKWLLIWRFQIEKMNEKCLAGASSSESLDVRSWDPDTDLRYTPTQKNMYISPVLRKKHFERTLRVPIFSVISVRLREGYMISYVSLNKNQNQIEVQLIFPWNHSASIKYYATTAWPVVRNVTKVEIYIEGTYEFLTDVTVGIGQESWNRSRAIVVRRFKHFLKGLSQTDHMLTHLLSFTSDPVHYTNIQKHVPLFYLPPNSNQLVLSSGKDSAQSAFSIYWKPILSLDVNIWQRWLHTHHIEIILQHDMPLPKHLHISSKSGRYHSIQTSFAMSQLSSLLREWSTFVLLENHSYVKFVYKENEDKPAAFYLVRLSNKAPMVVIRLAFLIGTTGPYRNLVLRELRSRVMSLTFPSPAKASTSLNVRAGGGVRSRNPSAQMRTRHISGPERQCAVLIHKPLERILVHYDHTPRDFMQPPSAGNRQGRSDASVRSATATGGEVGSTSQVQDLCRYMNHHRWVWSITNRSSTPVSLAVAGQMASLLVKIRLSEGFNFANCSSGVINMVREFPITLGTENSSLDDNTYYCLVQFIIFPPTVCTARESFSVDGSGDEEETTEADGELFLATEMWIEPQCGTVTMPESYMMPLSRGQASRHASGVSDGGKASRLSSVSSSVTATSTDLPYQRFLGLRYNEIPQVISKEDNALLSIMATIEHLRLMCLPRSSVLSGLPQAPSETKDSQHEQRKVPSDEYLYSMADEQRDSSNCMDQMPSSQPAEGITHVPRLFNLVDLLDRCPRVKLLFMTLSQMENDEPAEDVTSPNEYLFEYFHLSLGKVSDREAELTDADCSSITGHMIKRGRESNLEEPAEEREDKETTEGKWRCYLKLLPKAKVLVILLPSTYRDLKNFSNTLPGFLKSKSEPQGDVLSPTCNEEAPVPSQGNSNSASTVAEIPNVQEIPEEKPTAPEIRSLSRDDYRLARRRSIKRFHSQISKSGEEADEQHWSLDSRKDLQNNEEFCPTDSGIQLNLPVFVYECSTQSLVDQLVSDPISKPSLWMFADLEQDHRPSWIRDHCPVPRFSPTKVRLQKARPIIKSVDCKTDSDPVRPRSGVYLRSQSYPFNPAQTTTSQGNEAFFSVPSEDVFSSLLQPRILDPEVSGVCDNLVEAYHRCFVRGVANSLKVNGGKVASIDVQAATDAICQESVQEIDITQFLLITCPQVASFKEKWSGDLIDQRDHDDVFSLDSNSHIPVARVEPMVRHTSSTSSTTDPTYQESCRSTRKPRSSPPLPGRQQNPEEGRIEKSTQEDGKSTQMEAAKLPEKERNGKSGNVEENEKEESSSVGLDPPAIQEPNLTPTTEKDKTSSRSAFKKLRSRRTLRSPTKANSQEVSDTDGDTPESESQRSTHVGPVKSKLSSVRGNNDSLPRSLKVTKPLKKVTPGSRAGWDGLPEFPLSLLKETQARHLSGSDDQVKANFMKLLHQNFRPITSIPDFFYYNAQEQTLSTEDIYVRDNQDVEADNTEPQESGLPFDPVTESDQDVKFEFDDLDEDVTEAEGTLSIDDHLKSNRRDLDVPHSQSSQKKRKFKYRTVEKDLDGDDYFDKISGRLHSLSASEDSLYQEEVTEEDADNFPLFLCMTCTVRDKKTGNHGTMPVDGLPTSLRTVLSYLETPCNHVDLSQLYITLDLIWMMLPLETKDSEQKTPGCDEEDEDMFSSGLLPDEDDSPHHEAYGLKQRNNTVHEETGPMDPLATLPSSCLAVVNNTKEQIEWLLRDEIICALRTCETITRYTLEKVAKHVEESNGINCMKEICNLQFVFGTEKSFQRFVIEFEKTFKDFKGYRMKKEEPYYYFTMERTFLPIPHWPEVGFLGGSEALQNVGSTTYQQNRHQCLAMQDASDGLIAQLKSPEDNESRQLQIVTTGAQHVTLRRTKTAPTLVKSPITFGGIVKPCPALTQSVCPVHSSFSCQSLPSNEGTMSVDAIESDVGPPVEGSAVPAVVRQPSSSQSTPVRKTSSAIDLTSGRSSTSDSKPWSPRSGPQQYQAKCCKIRNSKVPTTDMADISIDRGSCTPPDTDKVHHRRKGPVKQRSVESNITSSDKSYQNTMRRSSHSVIPLSLRNSPLQYSGPTSPLVPRHLSAHNSSFSSGGSAQSLHTNRRSSQATTPVTQQVPGTLSISQKSAPDSSTPILPNQSGPSQAPGPPSANIPITPHSSNKDPVASPVSMSDGEFRRYSTASLFESGYDGEESDLDGDDDYMASLQDSANDLPSFWLLALVQNDNAKLYFHRRSSAAVQDVVDKEHKRIFQTVIDRVQVTCKRVNQILLLLELHDSRMCNALLVEETEEDIWKRDYNPPMFGIHSDDHADDSNRELLAATMTNAPGQFACDCVLEKVIHLHPRLKATGGVPGKSSVMATVRDLVRNLMVTNRKNMFVYLLPDKSVFFCRMEEDPGTTTGKGDSRRSSVLIQSSTSAAENVGSLAENLATTPERRSSRENLAGISQTEIKSGGTLTLRWYGVGLPNAQQQEELENMNQSILRKLDESVLEKITVLLQRKSKLSPADVLFIQQSTSLHPGPGRSPATYQTRPVTPSATLSYALPDQFAGCISAVRYYLHQNLLQFMAVPRYTDPQQLSGHFTPYRMRSVSSEPSPKFPGTPGSSASGDGSIFLFHQSIEPGKTGYGIACVVLEITDSNGKQLIPEMILRFTAPEKPEIEQLLKLTEITDYNSVDKKNSSMDFEGRQFDGSNNNQEVSEDASVNIPPKAVVRFHLWLKGSLTKDHLQHRLRPAVQHALFDSVTELFVVRSPLCDLHPSMKKEDDLPPMEFQKTKNVIVGKTDAMRSLFGSFNNDPSSSRTSIFSSIRHAKLDNDLKEEEAGQKQSGGKKLNTPTKTDRRKSASAQAEEGEVGNLKEIYQHLSETWFDNMEKNHAPAVFKMQMQITNMRCMMNILPDIQKIFATTLTDCKVKPFICPFGKSKMSPFDCEQQGKDPKKFPKIPGRYPSYILIARNFLLWRKAVGNYTLANQQTIAATAKFPPYDVNAKPDQSPRSQEHRLTTPSANLIPRQQFVLASVQKRCIKIWGYNISNETTRNLQTRLRRCIDFHNARQRALHCLTTKKLGLSRHCTYENGYSLPENAGNQPNPFLKDIKEVDIVLANSSLPADKDIPSKSSSKTTKRAFFNEAYLAVKPLRPLHLSDYGKEPDVATQYAKQYMEMKANLKKRGEEQQLLSRIFLNLRERPASISNTSLKKDVLQVLLRRSRLIHHVASPILFGANWRKLCLKLRARSGQDEWEDLSQSLEVQTSTKKQKRLSANIRKSGDFTGRSVDDSKSRSRSNSTRKENTKERGQSLPSRTESVEDCKYDAEDLRKALLMHYIQYWQSMHFLLVKEEKNGRSEKAMRKSGSVDKDAAHLKKIKSPERKAVSADKKDDLSQSMYLYRVASGGIVVVEISCVDMNFLVKLYILEAARLQYSHNVNQQMAVLFLNECEHLKDYTHVHSFAYDFHLRYVQWYIQDRQTAIKPGYHLVSFLTDFIEYYKTPPLFVFNHIQSGILEAPCSHVTSNELYEYIVGKQAAKHGFKPLKLTDNEMERNEHAMVSDRLLYGEFHSGACNKDDHDMYDVCYVVSHDTTDRRNSLDSGDRKNIKLKYFILFTNRRHLFPRFDLQDNLNPLQVRPRGGVVPIRRNFSATTNFLTKSSAEKPKGSEKTPTISHTKSNSLLVLSPEENVAPAPGSFSTSSLQKLKKQVADSEDGIQSSDQYRMHPQWRKKIWGATMSHDMRETLTPPLSADPTNVFSPPGPDKQRLMSQGRRQSLPNFGVTLRSKKTSQQNSSSSKQGIEKNKLQNSAGRTIQVAAEDIGSKRMDTGLPSFVLCEIERLQDFLMGICKPAEIQCYCNQLWDKVYMEKSSQDKSSKLSFKDFEHLLKHCQKVPLSKLDPRGVNLSEVNLMGVKWAAGLQKHLLNRFPQICRMFACDAKQYLGILNPKLYHMMLLVTVDKNEEDIGIFAVLRDKLEELERDQPDLTGGSASLIPIYGHLNNMIDFMCYHTWMTLL